MRELLSFLPSNNTEDPPRRADAAIPPTARTPELDTMVPLESRQAVRHQGRHRAPSSTTAYFFEVARALRAEHRRRLRAHRRARRSASSPTSRRSSPACLDIDASMKAARFVRFCDCFNIPLVTFVDVPGLPARHRPGVRRHHQARREAALRVRRGDGARRSPSSRARPTAARTTSWRSKHIRADVNFAFPTAEIAVMGPEGAVNIVYRKRDRQGARTRRRRAPRFVAEYREKFANPYKAAELGFIDEVIRPRDTRCDARRARSRCSRTSARRTRRGSTATSRCSPARRATIASSPRSPAPARRDRVSSRAR